MHYYRFSIGDYARSTRHLSNDEDLAYRRLIDMYYENEGPIPLETQWVARRIRMDSDTVQIVLDDMFQRTDEGYRHPRCDAEIEEYQKQADRNRANGKRGGRPKTLTKQQSENPVGFQSEPSPNPVVTLTTNHKPLTINQDLSSNDDCASGDALKPDHVADKWNEIAGSIGRPKIRALTPERRQLVRGRIAQYEIEDFVIVFGKVTESPFLRGERNWQGATFDWVMKKTNFQKILEGNYDA